MKKLIDKSVLVVEIERMKKSISPDRFLSEFEKGCNHGKEDICDDLLSFLDTLEVKEVDLEKEIGFFTTKELLKKRNFSTSMFHLTQSDIDNIAKHFFELGFKAKGE